MLMIVFLLKVAFLVFFSFQTEYAWKALKSAVLARQDSHSDCYLKIEK